ncbi:alkaline phosphatase family protein [Muricauda sp. SCSIO 64092]|uniref:alkaline phosphatase family protein n=1 Tax=Allomuricauda sp. SCSIO 64092 TaxID=2908842 RepID=UPI001FF436CF|nr:alkaline phosphatase family protein [Muricauda sp. SCSIO 64092]UOY07193.1 alkaline phosphatase family protein [Muricauda sp. SCSIO 64092]
MFKHFFQVGMATTIGILFLWSCSSKNTTELHKIEHIIVIGVDGMSPDGIQKAETPMLDTMIANGAATMYARSVFPSSSSPNWASMLMGADTEHHGITSNAWQKHDHKLPPVVVTKEGTFPTIFTLYNDQTPEAHVGAIYDWDDFGRLFEKTDVAFDINGDHEDGTTTDAVAYIKEHRPNFTFVHLDHVDHAGHRVGHGSSGYYTSVAKADSLISEIVDATKAVGIFGKTMFIVASDHGGLGYGHGGESPAEMTVPFILYGAGIKKGYTIEETVYQFDNASTVAYAAGLEQPQSWIGRPVKGAFIGNEKPVIRYKKKEMITAPRILPSTGHFTPAGGVFRADSAKVEMQNPNNDGTIHFTLDATEPTVESEVYGMSFYLGRTTVVKAAVFMENESQSTVSEGNFRLIPETKPAPVMYEVFHGDKMERLPEFKVLSPVFKGKVDDFSHVGILGNTARKEQVALVMESHLEVDYSGKYTFFINSDDGSKLYVNGLLLVDNDGNHGVLERSGSLDLEKGKHLIRVEFYNGGGGYHLDVRYKGPNVPKQIIPSNKLYTKAN